MLVLTRKVDDRITIANDIEILVVKVIDENTVRLGIKAPQDVVIARTELLKRPERKKQRPGE